MEENIGKKLKSTKGITLIALVITIIVLLILAGVSLNAVFNQDGIFRRAEQATDKYGQAKARETLELVLDEFQMTKYEEGLSGQNYENRLDSKIKEVGSLIPKEDENSKYQLVIVEGHIFEVDRSVPKIIDYKGPADGVIVTARITQNGDWKNPEATVTGTITKYGGGSVTSSSATATNGVTIPSDFPTTGGSYIIPNITTDTVITITTKDSEGKTKTHPITVNLVRDNTPPVISGQSVTANMMKIAIKARATDNESGLASLTYKIEPNTIKDGKAEGTLTSGEEVTVEATAEGNYTVTFTATDNANNISSATAGPVTITDVISVEDLKDKIDESNYPDYLGMKVDYNPTEGGTWRVFYYDAETASYPNGYFGDGDGTGPSKGTIYLKRDYDDSKLMVLTDYYRMSSATTNGLKMMKQLNPEWAEKDGVANLGNEKAAAGLCDTDNWISYCDTSVARYAIGTAPIEMWCKAQNVYENKYDASAALMACGIKSENGYGYEINGILLDEGRTKIVDLSIERANVIASNPRQWLASPASHSYTNVCCVDATNFGYSGCQPTSEQNGYAICPVVSLKH